MSCGRAQTDQWQVVIIPILKSVVRSAISWQSGS